MCEGVWVCVRVCECVMGERDKSAVELVVLYQHFYNIHVHTSLADVHVC